MFLHFGCQPSLCACGEVCSEQAAEITEFNESTTELFLWLPVRCQNGKAGIVKSLERVCRFQGKDFLLTHCYRLHKNSALLQSLEGSFRVLKDRLYLLCHQLVYWKLWE